MQVLLEFLFGRPGRAVDALQHLVAAVAAPVGAGQLGQAELPQLARIRHMRTATEINELALAVERNLLAFRQVLDDFRLVLFTFLTEELDGLAAVPDLARDRQRILDDAAHLGRDTVEIIHREARRIGKIVVKTVLDHRADGDLAIGVQPLHRLRQQVCGRVPDDFQTLGIPGGNNAHLRIVFDQMAGVA